MMKIAVVSPFPVLPPHGGNRARTYAMMKALKDMGHDVHFIFLPSRQVYDADYSIHCNALGFERVHWLTRGGLSDAWYYMRRGASKIRRHIGWRLSWPRAQRYALDEIFYLPFKYQLRAIQRSLNFDAVLVQYVSASKAFEAFDASVLKVLDTHDSFSDRSAEGIVRSYALTSAEQARGFRRADIVIAIQELEAARFRSHLGNDAARVRVVSHVLDLSRRVKTINPVGCFVGSTFDANIASLQYFLGHVLPLIIRVRPDFQVVVAGTIGATVTGLANVRTIGRVSHVSDAFEQGGIALNPIVKGTGINIKLLDALAAGVPSVSTAFGVRGMDKGSLRGIIVTPDNDAQSFADAVLQLYYNTNLRNALGEEAYDNAKVWNDKQLAQLRSVFADNERDAV